MAFLRSCSPPSIFLVSPASTCAASSSSARGRDRRRPAPPLRPTRRARRGRRRGGLQRLAELAVLFEAAAALQHLLRRGLVLPEVRGGDAFFDSGEFVCGACGVKDSSAGRWRGAPGPRTCEAVRRVAMSGHAVVLNSTLKWQATSVDFSIAPGIAAGATRASAASGERRATARRRGRRCGCRWCAPRGSAGLSTSTAARTAPLLQHAAVRIDEAADAGVRGARQVASVLDRAHRRLVPVLIRRRRPAVPGVVGDRREQLAAVAHEAPDQARVDHLVADRRARACGRRPAAARGSVAGREVGHRLDDRADEEQQPLERHVLAERHQVHLAIHRADRAVGLHEKGGVVVGACGELRAAAPVDRLDLIAADEQRRRRPRGQARIAPPRTMSSSK